MENNNNSSLNAAQEVEILKAQIASLIEKIDTWEGIHSNSYYIETLQSTVNGVDDESKLFDLTVKYPSLSPHIMGVLKALTRASDYKRDNSLWINERCRAGKILAEGFALAEKTNIPILIDFIQSYDARVDETVLHVWNRWGFCQETCELIVIYMMQAENGVEVIAELDGKEPPISETLKNEKNAELFLQYIWNWLESEMSRQGYDTDDLESSLQPIFQTVFMLTDDEAEKATALVVEWIESDGDVAAPTLSQIITPSI